ncbi:histidine phosphatase family protein [bacterium]|nr:histidine phosphatase family protein [bacterium]
MTTVLLLRHGETELNRSGALRGQIDVPLSPAGEREAERLAQRVRDDYALTAIYASPLARARATAAAVGAASRIAVEVDPRFTDLDYGAWAGRTVDTFSATERQRFRDWLRRPDVPLPGADDPRTIQDRAFAGLVERTASAAGCIAIVSHDAILQLLFCRMLGIPLRSYRGIVQHTATLNELGRDGDTWAVRLLNSTWHLDEPE